MATAKEVRYSSANSEEDQHIEDVQKSTEEDEQQTYLHANTADTPDPPLYDATLQSKGFQAIFGNSYTGIVSPCSGDENNESKDIHEDFNVEEAQHSFNGNDVIFIIKEDEENESFVSATKDESDDDLVFHVGSTFDHYAKVVKAIQAYERRNHVRLYRRDSRTLSSIISRGRAPKKNFSMDLRYGELCYRCRHGGKKYKSFSTGIRPNQSSFKQGCEMHIRFGVSDDGTRLVVKSMSEEHNHEINEETVVKEALHPDLCTFVSKLVWSDINISIDEVKKRLEHYVCDEMFKDQAPPPRTRRQYYPSKKQIRYFMSKAKSSLNITEETEIKLEAQVERFKETRGDEKMLFNFKVSQPGGETLIPPELAINSEDGALVDGTTIASSDNDLFTGGETTSHESKPVVLEQEQLLNDVSSNGKILFCHQTPHQQRLMRRYSSQLILTQISDVYSKIPFPLFCLYVQTNVDYQLVGEFILQANTCVMIMEGLQAFKEWNPGWSPKFIIVDFSEEQITAAEATFPGTFVLISDASREKAWSDWLSLEENEVFEYKDEITQYLQAIATSYSEDMLNRAARELEESSVWKMSDKLRNWFQLNWLSQAKRWVAGYRPDDFLLLIHHGRTLEMELKNFKNIKLVNKTALLQDVIQQIVENVAPIAKSQYEQLNAESFKLQSRLKYLNPDIPNYLACRPAKLTYHVFERVKLASEQTYTLTYLHPGIFTVQCCSTADDDLLHTVSFGDTNSFPSCDCLDWLVFKLPCVHLCAVFNNYPGWTWDMLSIPYKSSPVLNVDWSFLPEHSVNAAEQLPGNIIDKSTQTSDVTLISNSAQLSKMTKMSDPRRMTETPQVLASQCRGLLQQLTKMQLANHGRNDLYRLKSNLKELIYIFSNSTSKQKTLSTTASAALIDPIVMQTRAPVRTTKKLNQIDTPLTSTIFQQFTAAPGSTTDMRLQNSTAQQIVLTKSLGGGGEQVSEHATNNLLNAVFILNNPSTILGDKSSSSQNMLATNLLQGIKTTNQQQQSVVKLKSIVRKRGAESTPMQTVFLSKEKRVRSDDLIAANDETNFHGELCLDFTPESVEDRLSAGGNGIHVTLSDDDGLQGATLLSVDEHTLHSVGMQLAHVPLSMSHSVEHSNATSIMAGHVTAASLIGLDSASVSDTSLATVTNASIPTSLNDVSGHVVFQSPTVQNAASSSAAMDETTKFESGIEAVATLSHPVEVVAALGGPIDSVATLIGPTESVATLQKSTELVATVCGSVETVTPVVQPIKEVDSQQSEGTTMSHSVVAESSLMAMVSATDPIISSESFQGPVEVLLATTVMATASEKTPCKPITVQTCADDKNSELEQPTETIVDILQPVVDASSGSIQSSLEANVDELSETLNVDLPTDDGGCVT